MFFSLFVFSATSLDSSLSLGSGSSANLLTTALCEKDKIIDYNGLDFRIIIDSKSGSGPAVTVILVASTLQEKAAWCSDIGQVGSSSKKIAQGSRSPR